ncbi:hypothetical protein SEA_CAIN_99 [Mycobacterium phage Cain]|uniref:Uncharacterized protein n=1 Tax=Mycobacterium phage Bryler TaxID=2653755 RepID=A0A5Q2WNL1_9CAUD|nr:hypothetical protein I5G79_gp07 [Mycobacterium phage Bryler]ASR85498.1 hypothetical protein SEA_CAIN_99 [Mycobacterium phage Cain]QGH80466.1 hypothetical protein SEA_BRYLER_91 [Mycobacterium phage Bryler]
MQTKAETANWIWCSACYSHHDRAAHIELGVIAKTGAKGQAVKLVPGIYGEGDQHWSRELRGTIVTADETHALVRWTNDPRDDLRGEWYPRNELHPI